MKRKNKQKGFTLVLILILSIIVLTVTAVTLHQLSGKTNEIVRKKNMDAAKSNARGTIKTPPLLKTSQSD